jgi:hypothetical protein
MKTWINKNEHGKHVLSVDAYDRLSKKEFSSLLSELEGIKIVRAPTIFSPGDFCSFEYKGEQFSIDEDDYEYSYIIKPATYNPDTLQALENYFSNLSIPKNKTRPVFWFAGAVLLGLALYANLSSS